MEIMFILALVILGLIIVGRLSSYSSGGNSYSQAELQHELKLVQEAECRAKKVEKQAKKLQKAQQGVSLGGTE